jgi:hypothetical protein
MSKNNYKAKWLSAINNSGNTLADTYRVAEGDIEEINAAQVNATLTMSRIRNPLIEAAANAKALLNLMDECRQIGNHEFAETTLPLDGKLSKMDLVTIARRTRDVVKIATARIGLLSVALDDAYETITKYESSIATMKPFAEGTAKTMTELFIVGVDPSERELQDVEAAYANGSGEYMRFGETYEDADDSDWELTPLTSGSNLREKRVESTANGSASTTKIDDLRYNDEVAMLRNMTANKLKSAQQTERAMHDAVKSKYVGAQTDTLKEANEDNEDGPSDSDEDDETSDAEDAAIREKQNHQRHDSAIALIHTRNRSAQVVPTTQRTLADEMDL